MCTPGKGCYLYVNHLSAARPLFILPPFLPSSFLSFPQQAEMEERRQFMLDQILLPEAKERLARIGTWCVCVCLCVTESF